MIEFNQFKKEVCNFYRQNGEELHYLIYVDAYFLSCYVKVEFKIYNVKIVYSYKLSDEYKDAERRNKKANKLMKELIRDLGRIEKELKE